MADPDRRTVAVIGAGVSGLTAAYLLQRAYDVTLYEAEPRLGGHAHTHDVVTPDERIIPIDSGFIVHNDRTYPYLLRLFGELGVETQASDMSMSVRCDGCGLEYAGARGLGGVFARARQRASPAFLRMLVEVKRFHRHARQVLEAPEPDPARVLTLQEFLEQGRYSRYFVRHFMVPLVSCVWSCPPRPRSSTRPGTCSSSSTTTERSASAGRRSGGPWSAARRYVERIAKGLTATALSTPVRQRRPHHGRRRGPRRRRRVWPRSTASVVATHADEALALLDAPTTAERATLGAFEYSVNETVLHTDASLLPRTPGPCVVELSPGGM